MKPVLLGALVLIFVAQSMAAISTPPSEKQYKFVVTYKSDKFEYSQKAGSWEEAYTSAAEKCFNHFKAGRHVGMDEGEDIINKCANPRSI